MATSSILASFYFVCGAIIFFLAVAILRHSVKSIVNWATALVLFFAGFGPILGAMGVLLERNLLEGTVLFKNLVASFDYIWEFFFPSLLLFALVYPRRSRIWGYIKKYIFILFLPHVFHLFMLIFLMQRVKPDKIFLPLVHLAESAGPLQTFLTMTAGFMNVLMELLFKAHMQLFSLVNIAYAAFSLVLLGSALRKDIAPRVRRQLQVVITGLGLCILTYSWARLIPFLAGITMPEGVPAGFMNASLILGGGSIAYSIVRHQFLDMRLIARRGILYAATASLLASIYLLTIRQITQFFYQFSGARVEILETGFIILFIIAFQPLLGRLEDWAERVLVKEQKNPRARIRSLSGELVAMIDIEMLKVKVQEVLSDVFMADRVELVLEEDILRGVWEPAGDAAAPASWMGAGGGTNGSTSSDAGGDGAADDDEAGGGAEAVRVLEFLSQVGEPIEKLDVIHALGFPVPEVKRFRRRSRSLSSESIEALPEPVKHFAEYELIVPIVQQDRCNAVLLLGARKEHDHYHPDEQALLSMLASQIAVSLGKIELLAEVVEKKIIEEELNIARAIQLNLLPSSPPELEDYEVSALSLSSKQVGGDYYDFLHRDSQLSIAVADVSGKGIPASLLMASLQASLRSMAGTTDEPVEVVEKLNEVMFQTTSSDKFVTLFFGNLDLRCGVLSYTNAGHLFPVVVREGGKIEVLDYSGLILGVKPDFPYEKRELELGPGDAVVVVTDGVTEAESPAGEMFGEKRFYELVSGLRARSAADIMHAVVRSVEYFSAPLGARDDLTILVLKRKEGKVSVK